MWHLWHPYAHTWHHCVFSRKRGTITRNGTIYGNTHGTLTCHHMLPNMVACMLPCGTFWYHHGTIKGAVRQAWGPFRLSNLFDCCDPHVGRQGTLFGAQRGDQSNSNRAPVWDPLRPFIRAHRAHKSHHMIIDVPCMEPYVAHVAPVTPYTPIQVGYFVRS